MVNFSCLVVALALPVFVLGGCVPSRAIGAIEAADRVAEGETDKTLAFVKRRLCRLPVDVMGRAANANADDARAMFYGCPEVRALALSVLRAVGEGGFDVSVNVGPAE